MELELNVSANNFVDFALGKVVEGKEAMVFQEYSPAVGPVMRDLEIKSLRPFAVVATNMKGEQPVQGAFTRFKKVENYKKFLADPRFLAVKPLRDEGMVFLNDGNMFEATGESVSLDSDNEYAIVLSGAKERLDAELFQWNLTENSPNEFFKGKSLSLHNWNDQAEKLMESDADETTVIRVRFFPEQR